MPEDLPLVGRPEDPLVKVGNLEPRPLLWVRHVRVEADQHRPRAHVTAEPQVVPGSRPHPVVGERCGGVLAEQPVRPCPVGDQPGEDGRVDDRALGQVVEDDRPHGSASTDVMAFRNSSSEWVHVRIRCP